MVEVDSLLERVKKLMELGELTRRQSDILDEIKKTLATEINLGTFAEIEKRLRIAVKLVTNNIFETECTSMKGIVEFNGRTITVGDTLTYPIDLNSLTLNNLLKLYHLDICNPGMLDIMIKDVMKMNEELTQKLEMLKKILTLVKTVLK